VVPPKDTEALARCMTECLKDQSRLAAMAADAETVAAEFSRSSIAQKTWAIYGNLLKAKENDLIRIRTTRQDKLITKGQKHEKPMR